MYTAFVFQLLFPSFCIDPQLSSLDIIALDYLTAFYLILLTYIVLQLYSHNFKPLVLLWRRRVLIRFYKKASIKTSVFATFILLSYVKLIYVSSDILNLVYLRRPNGEFGQTAWVHNGSILYFGRTHAGFGVLAILVSLIFVLVPVLLLFLYPFQFFLIWIRLSKLCRLLPRALQERNKWHRDCRHFSAAYLLIRICDISTTHLAISSFTVTVGGLIVLSFTTTIFVFRPYKKDIHTIYMQRIYFTDHDYVVDVS